MKDRAVDIEHPTKYPLIEVGDLKVGSFFEYNDEVYVKIKGHTPPGSYLCYSFDKGTKLFESSVNVIPLSASIVLDYL